MIGQWLGQVEGTNKGLVEMNIEGLVEGFKDLYGARVLFSDQDNSNVNFYCIFQFKITDRKVEGKLFDFFIFDYRTNQLIARDIYKKMYPDSNTPTGGEAVGIIEGDIIKGSWDTNIYTKGNFVVKKSQVDKESKADYVMEDWDNFIEWLSESKNRSGIIYRGQGTLKRLRTTFSRSNRNDLIRYAQTDIKTLVHHINAVSGHIFDLEHKPKDYYALLNLAQHHGYPTPLLDWTESPYVAAYFAYQDIKKEEKDGYVRIFVFDSNRWKARCPQLVNIFDPRLSITVDTFPIINNNRASPQQSIFALTNVDDVEGFIKLYEDTFNEKYLTKIDLPISGRNRIMNELQLMGITAASLFPGFDGICKYLKERFF